MSKQVRQGDVLLHPIDKIPEGATPLKGKGKIVLAEGEVTGHSHTIKRSDRISSFLKDNILYLTVEEPMEVNHQEHSTLVLEPGHYEVKRQVEVWMDEVRQVAD